MGLMSVSLLGLLSVSLLLFDEDLLFAMGLVDIDERRYCVGWSNHLGAK